ncbi:MAG TPA: hypothetical protein VIE65_15420 [Methylobacter sp.]
MTPDKIEQYELLLLDQKSIRRLADQTLNDETVITDENAEQLLEAMRRATVEDERLQYEQKLKSSKAVSDKKLKSEQELTARAHATATEIAEQRDAALAQLEQLRSSRFAAIQRIAENTNKFTRLVDQMATSIVFIVAIISSSNYLFGWLANYRVASIIVGGILALFGAYHAIMNALERPKIGVPTVMSWLAQKNFIARLARSGLLDDINLDRVQFDRGRVILDDAIPQGLLSQRATTISDGASTGRLLSQPRDNTDE